MDPISIIDLPIPPSLNNLFVNAGKRGRVLSRHYKEWREEAGWKLLRQRPGSIKGRYALEIYVQADARADIGNLEKAVSDLLQAHGVIENDSLAWALHIYRDIRISEGCRLVVRSVIPELEVAA